MPEDLDQKSKMKVKVFEKFDPTTNKYRYYAKAFTPSIKKNGCEYFPV